MRPRIFNPNVRHSLTYYKSVLDVLIATNAENKTYAEIAVHLNNLEIKTSGGLTWTPENVKGVLRKIRLYKEMPSKISQALLELVFTNELELRATLPLFKSRLHGTM